MRNQTNSLDAPTAPIPVPGTQPRRRFRTWTGVAGLSVALLLATGFVVYGLPSPAHPGGQLLGLTTGTSTGKTTENNPNCIFEPQKAERLEVPSELEPDRLEPAMREAFQAARCAARADGVDIFVKSARRTAAEQRRLYRAEIKKRGSEAEARKWVLPPEESAHVKGTAVDVKPQSGAKWLERYGSQWGLCRTIEREWWHFEHSADWAGKGCPDPR
ncbi:M15 family metallopeptidase [Crossiella sp. CA-258035]|uniref:M15 family metallopeptidase n=1 Tax=Crossiella sp. CA-258035 TaxID=2981138 RepID=UPI0024BC8B27|nr:M15 family metallopeptidase [Crossiella sp. CA-258035]WHT19132.1 M15 family metallopeptidase [Crossiella sp. CA-258035]